MRVSALATQRPSLRLTEHRSFTVARSPARNERTRRSGLPLRGDSGTGGHAGCKTTFDDWEVVGGFDHLTAGSPGQSQQQHRPPNAPARRMLARAFAQTLDRTGSVVRTS